MIRTFLSLYTPKLPIYFVYMLQQVEYEPRKFLNWLEELFRQGKSVQSTTYRKKLVWTTKATVLVAFSYALIAALLVGAVLLADPDLSVWFAVYYFLAAVFIAPFVLELTLALLSLLAWVLLVKPSQQRQISAAKKKLADNKAIKIAIIGSYGKTTMKELLGTILHEGKKVAVTPGNKNTALSQARFIQKLDDDEEVLIFEFGEGQPGDVAAMTKNIQPDYAVITGLAPNHLDHYPSVKAVADDLLSVLKSKKTTTYITAESSMLQEYVPKKTNTFNAKSVMSWKISGVLVSVADTTFVMNKGKTSLNIKTGLLGRHQVGPIAFGAALAHELGLTKKQIETGCANIEPFDHRMQPRHVNGAWLIDDTYNGNIEGLVAGLQLLDELDFKRKWYVTPGLVDQGPETESVHTRLGKVIAEVSPDIVVLMDNSARPVIEKAMNKHKFKGKLRVESKPLEFYQSIEHQLAAGDIVLMQNDWTDNYN